MVIEPYNFARVYTKSDTNDGTADMTARAEARGLIVLTRPRA